METNTTSATPARPSRAQETQQAKSTSLTSNPSPTSPWTWVTALVVLGLVLASYAFIYALIARGVDPKLATGITLPIVIVIVICVVPSKSGGTIGRRLMRALAALFSKDD